MKRCTKCGLSVGEGAVFTKGKQKIDGLNCSCKKCRSEYAKQHYCSENGREARKRYLLSDKRIKSLKKHQQTDGVIRVYSGAVPANADEGAGTLLLEISVSRN